MQCGQNEEHKVPIFSLSIKQGDPASREKLHRISREKRGSILFSQLIDAYWHFTLATPMGVPMIQPAMGQPLNQAMAQNMAQNMNMAQNIAQNMNMAQRFTYGGKSLFLSLPFPYKCGAYKDEC
jgi:hypothetical protein